MLPYSPSPPRAMYSPCQEPAPRPHGSCFPQHLKGQIIQGHSLKKGPTFPYWFFSLLHMMIIEIWMISSSPCVSPSSPEFITATFVAGVQRGLVWAWWDHSHLGKNKMLWVPKNCVLWQLSWFSLGETFLYFFIFCYFILKGSFIG